MNATDSFASQMQASPTDTVQQLPVRHIDVAALTRTARQVLDKVRTIIIDCPDMYDVARDEITGLKSQHDAIEESRLERTRPLDAKKKELMDEVREPLTLYKEAIKIVTDAAADYARKAEAARREAERVQRERERKEREEREAEARRQEEIERAARLKVAEKLAEAEKLEQAAAPQEAAKLREEADQAANQARQASTIAQETRFAPPTVHTQPVAPAAGTRRSWKAECTDKAALLAYVAANPTFLNLFDLNQSALSALARAQGEHLNLPGVRAFEDLGVTAKRR